MTTESTSTHAAGQADPGTFIARVAGGEKALNASLAFEATDATGKKLQLIALSEVMLETYTVYFETAAAPNAPLQPAIAAGAHVEVARSWAATAEAKVAAGLAAAAAISEEEAATRGRPHASPRWQSPNPAELEL